MRIDLGPSLDALKVSLCAQVDAEAEAARLRWITPGAGQAMEYQATYDEAHRYTLTPAEERAAQRWPWLEAEANVSRPARELSVVAQEVLYLQGLWVEIGARIKELRRAAKVAVMAARTVPEARQAAQVRWPLPKGDE